MLATTKATNNGISARSTFSHEQIETIRRTVAKGCDDTEFQMFMAVCHRTGLDPFARQLYAVPRWDSKANRNIMSLQVSIDGFRLIAARTGKYRGQVGAYWCGKDGQWRDVWLEDEPPAAAKVGVLHADFKDPLYRVAKFSSFVQTNKDGKPNQFWGKMPELMIAKVAESQALRAAFPQELSGLYTPDEMGNPEVQVELENQTYDVSATVVNPVVDPVRKELQDKILQIMREKGLTKEFAVSVMKSRYQGKTTRDQLSTEELADFVQLLFEYAPPQELGDEEIPFN